MKETDILNTIKKSIREELDREADKVIEKLCEQFKDELRKSKNVLVAELLNNVDMEVNSHPTNKEVVYQIVIKGGMKQ